jgi:dihydropteroate synthase type 2
MTRPAIPTPHPRIVGILNLTRDSFSDGGRYLDPTRAVEQARRLVADGADVVELGPASSHPDAEHVAPEEEIRRLEAVAPQLLEAGISIGVDSYRFETQRWCIEQGFGYLNDIQGFADARIWESLAAASCEVVVMHSIQRLGPATRDAYDAATIVDEIELFFEKRIADLEAAGIRRERILLDPGMGFFLGKDPEPSIAVLRALPRLRSRFAIPVLVSVSRKSFLGALCVAEPGGRKRAIEDRLAATLTAELFAARMGVDAIRTHDVRALRDALRVESALGLGAR